MASGLRNNNKVCALQLPNWNSTAQNFERHSRGLRQKPPATLFYLEISELNFYVVKTSPRRGWQLFYFVHLGLPLDRSGAVHSISALFVQPNNQPKKLNQLVPAVLPTQLSTGQLTISAARIAPDGRNETCAIAGPSKRQRNKRKNPFRSKKKLLDWKPCFSLASDSVRKVRSTWTVRCNQRDIFFQPCWCSSASVAHCQFSHLLRFPLATSFRRQKLANFSSWKYREAH